MSVMRESWVSFFSLKTLFIAVMVSALAVNCFYLGIQMIVLYHKRDVIKHEPGTQFADMKSYLRDVPHLGYLTNKNMNPDESTQEFLQAQYMLAPSILHLNDTTRDVNILDYTHPVFYGYVMQTLHSDKVYLNPYGKLLARIKE